MTHQIASDMGRLRSRGYELIKHDITFHDLMGRWANSMGSTLTDDNWTFAEGRRWTTAEVVLALYRTIREGAGDTLFRASKRGLHWLTLSDGGAGLALLKTEVPLLGRADMTGMTLLASRETAGDYGLSRQRVADHAIHAVKGKSLSGAFILRAFSASGVTAAAPK